jgi:uncharacterized protein YhaN
MFVMDTAVLTVLGGVIVACIGALATAIVKVIKALKQAVDARDTAASLAVESVADAKAVAATHTDDIRRDLSSVIELVSRVDARFFRLEKKVDSMGKEQASMMEQVVVLDRKLTEHMSDEMDEIHKMDDLIGVIPKRTNRAGPF